MIETEWVTSPLNTYVFSNWKPHMITIFGFHEANPKCAWYSHHSNKWVPLALSFPSHTSTIRHNFSWKLETFFFFSVYILKQFQNRTFGFTIPALLHTKFDLIWQLIDPAHALISTQSLEKPDPYGSVSSPKWTSKLSSNLTPYVTYTPAFNLLIIDEKKI